MPQNPFASTVEGLTESLEPAQPAGPQPIQPVAPPDEEEEQNPFASTVSRMQSANDAALRVNLRNAEQTSPDRQAEILSLAERAGLPPDVVERNFDQVVANTKARAPVGKIQSESPSVAAALADPATAALVQDDLEPLGWLEWMVTAGTGFGPLQEASRRGEAQVRVGQLEAASMFRELTAEEHQELEAEASIMEAPEVPVDRWWWQDAMLATTQILPGMASVGLQALKRAIPAAATAGTGAALAGQAGPQAFAPEELITVPAATAAGGTAGAIVGSMEASFQLEGGLALREFRQFEDEYGNTIDPMAAQAAAMVVGGVNAGIELLQINTLLRTFPPLAVAAQAMRRATTRRAAQAALSSPTLRGALAKAARTWIGATAAETAQEGLQGATTLFGGEVAKVFSEADQRLAANPGIQQKTAEDIRGEIEAELIGGFEALALLPVPGAMVQVGVAAGQVRRAREARQFFEALGEAVPNSKTVERMPAAARDILARATKDGPVESVFAPVDTWETYWQEKGLDPAEMAERVTGDSDAFATAKREGTDLVIPTADYAVNLAGTEHHAFFQDELRMGADQMNGREVAAFEQQVADAATVEPTVETAALRADIQVQLEAAGFEGGAASSLAAFYEQTFTTLGARAGVDPQQLFQSYNLAVNRAETSPGGLSQEALPLGNAVFSDDTVSVGDTVGGLTVQPESETVTVPNQESIDASLDDFEVLPGIRRVPMSQFVGFGERGVQADRNRRVEQLRDEIQESGEIVPLILVEDNEGLYVLEGGHRADALAQLGVDEFPAMVVRDLSEGTAAPQDVGALERAQPQDVAVDQTQADAVAVLQAFESWFADSVVTDPQGRPKLMYHGGSFDPQVDDVFDVSNEGTHFGSAGASQDRIVGRQSDVRISGVEVVEEDGKFFWSIPDFSLEQSDDVFEDGTPVEPGYDTLAAARTAGERAALEDAAQAEVGEADAIITPVYLSIQNPLRVPDMGDWDIRRTAEAAQAAIENTDAQSLLQPEVDAILQIAGTDATAGWDALKESLRVRGFDGFVYFNEFEDKGKDSYVVFRPEQVKSPESVGFDPTKPGILSQGPSPARLRAIEANERLSDEVEEFATEVREQFGLQDFTLATFGERHPNVILLDLLRVPKEARKQGAGTKAMEALIAFADDRGLSVILTPATAVAGETTSRSRLVKFYKRFGFRENKGRRADFSLPIQGGMVRPPAIPLAQPGPSFAELSVAAVTEQDKRFETGRPVSFTFIRNTEGAPDFGARFQQDIEPLGRYMLVAEPEAPLTPGWERGRVRFTNPLVLEFNTGAGALYDGNSWKARLAAQFGSTGADLSADLRAAGFDGIVTVMDGRTSEVVDLGTVLNQGPLTPGIVPSETDRLQLAPWQYDAQGRLRISTRVPDPIDKHRPRNEAAAAAGPLRTDLDAVLAHPTAANLVKRAAAVYRDSPLTRGKTSASGSDRAVIRQAIKTMKANLRFLWDAVDPEERERARQWYVGGHRIATDLSTEFGVTLEQAAAVIATLSPEQEWNINISLARRVLALQAQLSAGGGARFTEARIQHLLTRRVDAATSYAAQAVRDYMKVGDSQAVAQEKADAHLAKKLVAIEADAAAVRGKRWKQLTPHGRAMLLRVVDEMTNSPSHEVYAPEGHPVGIARNKPTPAQERRGEPGNEKKISWKTYSVIDNAISIIEDGSPENIDVRIGNQHKVRSFFQNLVDPTNPHAVTVDTHSTAAAWMQPFGGGSLQVTQTLGASAKGSAGDNNSGLMGMNPFVAQAHFELAEELGVLPREVQSVTWESLRAMFSPAAKRNKQLSADVADVWNNYTTLSKMKLSEVHDAIQAKAGVRARFDWADSAVTEADQQGDVSRSPGGRRPSGVPAGRRAARADTGRAPRADARDRGRATRPPRVLFQPAGGDARGRIVFGDRAVQIDLFESADLSTFLHETGHFYLKVLTDLTAALPAEGRTPAQQQLADDLQAALSWMGVDSVDDIGTPQHEQWARGFEAYLREGRAPSAALRQTFARFRAWLVSVYQQVAGLNVEINDDIRSVFDRLVATDEAIESAKLEARVEPLFTTAASAGMTEEAFASYQATVAEASEAAQQQVQQKLLDEQSREQKRWWKNARKVAKAEVEARVHAMPAYRALAGIRTGKNPDGTPLIEGEEPEAMKLDRAGIVKASGKGVLAELPKFLYINEGGRDPQQVAELFGFASADAMVQALSGLPPMKRVIDQQTDALMLERHGDMRLDGSLAEAAAEAVNDVGRVEIVRAELAALEAGIVSGTRTAARQVTQKVLPPAAVVNEAARKRIAGLTRRELKPGLFLQAAQRASRQAFTLLAQNVDRAAAVDAKYQELINLALYREALRVRDKVDKDLAWVADHNTAAARQRTAQSGEAYLEQWDGFLDRYEFSRVTGKQLDRRTSLKKFVESQEALGLNVDIPEEIVEELNRRNFAEIPTEELAGVVDAMRQLLHLSRLKNRLLRANEKRELDELANDLAGSISEHSSGRKEQALEPNLPPERKRRAMQKFFAESRRLASLIRQMDGGQDGGALWEAIMRPLNEAADTETDMRADVTEKLAAALNGFSTEALLEMNTPRHVPGLGKSLSRAGRITIGLNWGNEQNRQRVIDGFGWTDDQVQAVIDSLDAQDWTFIRTVWKEIDSFWPAIEAKQKRIYGVAPERVVRTPFETAHGTQPGGYFPIKFDPLKSNAAFADSVAQIAKEMSRGAATLSTTRRGHTKQRVDEVKGRPLKLDFTTIFQHVNEVIHDLTHHEVLTDANRILRHPAMRQAIIENYSEPVYRVMSDALRDIAAGTIPVEHQTDRAVSWMVQGTSIARMGLNLMTSLVQPLGLTVSIVRIGPKWVAQGVGDWLGDAVKMENTVEQVHNESSFMRRRHQTLMREVAEIQNQITPRGAAAAASIGSSVVGNEKLGTAAFRAAQMFATFEDTYFYFISRAQMIADIPTYLGAKEKALAEGNDMRRAIALADQAVIDSQGSGLIKDLAQVQRGGPLLKLFTQFMGYFNVVYNQGAEAMARRRQRDNPASRMRTAVDLLMLYTVPMVIEKAVRDAVQDRDEEDESFMVSLAKEQLSYIMATVVFARELTGSLEGFRYGGPAGAGLFQEVSKLIMQAGQGELDTAFWRSVNQVGGIVFHYPATEVERLARAVFTEEASAGERFSALFGGRPDK